ncbi:9647_t:CDS:2 [Ambispora gerdemannii]|uniref:ethanolamine kinase n=1 Tax=Ambispora gerdemannii TaxID=144530 RepID=A0A9N9DMZ1_9GLOM|nr:9647_t:CDS:2 [Ambispora gerdemannii]
MSRSATANNSNNGVLEFGASSINQVKQYIDNNKVLNLDYEIDHSRLFECAAEIAVTVYPEWNKNDLECSQFTDGLTNKLIRCKNKKENFILLIRTYGTMTEMFLNREQEIQNIISLSHFGFAAPIYARFKNGIAYGYVHGRPLTLEDCQNPEIYGLIAKKIAELHRIDVAGSQKPLVFLTIHDWISKVPPRYRNAKFQAQFEKDINWPQLVKDINHLEQQILKLNAPVKFCHNDLLSLNIIYNEDEKRVSFIDWEYGCYGYRSLDIALHFINFAGFEASWHQCPKKDYQIKWLRHYLLAYNSGTEITDYDVELLYREVTKFGLVGLIHIGLWALLQANLSDLDFDFMGYAVELFNEFYRRRDHEQILKL